MCKKWESNVPQHSQTERIAFDGLAILTALLARPVRRLVINNIERMIVRDDDYNGN